MVVTADAADPARDEVRVARVDSLHEDVEPTEDHRRAVALVHLLVGEVDLGMDSEAPDDPRDRIPGHLLDEDLLLAGRFGRHFTTSGRSRCQVSSLACATPARGRTCCSCCVCGSTARAGRMCTA